METKHTPGPWKQRPGCPHIITRDYGFGTTGGELIGSVSGYPGSGYFPEPGAALANARLIAAAPDLLNALIAIDQRMTECAATPASAADTYDSYYQEMVRDAIAKATRAEG